MKNDDFTNDVKRNLDWFLPTGWTTIEILKMEEGTSKAGNSKYMFDVVQANGDSEILSFDLTNIPGKRFMLRQIIEACGIEPRIETIESYIDENGIEIETQKKKIYDWEIKDIEGKTIQARIEHRKEDDWVDKNNKTQEGKLKARFVQFKKMGV